jgi:hypothetical protein
MSTYTGSCLCGGVQYKIQGPLAPAQICHCSQCRKAQGTVFATNTPVSTQAFEMTCGQELLASYESSPGKKRVFCSRCGSPVYSHLDSLPGVLRIRLGLINEPVDIKPMAHFYTGSKANWWPISDDLPQFDAGREPLKQSG